MKKNKVLKILAIIVGILFVLYVFGNIVFSIFASKYSKAMDSDIFMYFENYEVTMENLTSQVKGTGEITSFNIQTLDVSNYAKIKESYVNDGDVVTQNQKILSINTDGYVSDVKAPIAGMFFKIDNGTEIKYQIFDTTNVGVEISVNEKDVASLSVGQKAIVKISALNKEVEGSVTYVSKLPVDGKFKVRVKVDYFDELRFGYGVNVKINVAEKQNVMVIPYQALYMDNDNKYYVIKDEYKEEYYNSFILGNNFEEKYRTYVEIGTITNNKVEIISGLNVGDKIVEWIM